jgi:hypothetical protein
MDQKGFGIKKVEKIKKQETKKNPKEKFLQIIDNFGHDHTKKIKNLTYLAYELPQIKEQFNRGMMEEVMKYIPEVIQICSQPTLPMYILAALRDMHGMFDAIPYIYNNDKDKVMAEFSENEWRGMSQKVQKEGGNGFCEHTIKGNMANVMGTAPFLKKTIEGLEYDYYSSLVYLTSPDSDISETITYNYRLLSITMMCISNLLYYIHYNQGSLRYLTDSPLIKELIATKKYNQQNPDSQEEYELNLFRMHSFCQMQGILGCINEYCFVPLEILNKEVSLEEGTQKNSSALMSEVDEYMEGALSESMPENARESTNLMRVVNYMNLRYILTLLNVDSKNKDSDLESYYREAVKDFLIKNQEVLGIQVNSPWGILDTYQRLLRDGLIGQLDQEMIYDVALARKNGLDITADLVHRQDPDKKDEEAWIKEREIRAGRAATLKVGEMNIEKMIQNLSIDLSIKKSIFVGKESFDKLKIFIEQLRRIYSNDESVSSSINLIKILQDLNTEKEKVKLKDAEKETIENFSDLIISNFARSDLFEICQIIEKGHDLRESYWIKEKIAIYDSIKTIGQDKLSQNVVHIIYGRAVSQLNQMCINETKDRNQFNNLLKELKTELTKISLQSDYANSIEELIKYTEGNNLSKNCLPGELVRMLSQVQDEIRFPLIVSKEEGFYLSSFGCRLFKGIVDNLKNISQKETNETVNYDNIRTRTDRLIELMNSGRFICTKEIEDDIIKSLRKKSIGPKLLRVMSVLVSKPSLEGFISSIRTLGARNSQDNLPFGAHVITNGGLRFPPRSLILDIGQSERLIVSNGRQNKYKIEFCGDPHQKGHY